MTPASHEISPRVWYQTTAAEAGFVCDAQQLEAVGQLDALWQKLVDFKRKRNQFLGHSLLSPEVPKGVYICGGVGRGKTFLMDGFYECLPYRRKRRVHFHQFMAEVHQAMKRLAHAGDPLLAAADEIEQATRLLCLDEFHVEDIADAMILGRLLKALFERGVVLLTTSNQAPDGLYPNGLQRGNFLPAIALLERELEVLHLDGGKDYRTAQMVREPLFVHPSGSEADERLHILFKRLAAGSGGEPGRVQAGQRGIPARMVAHEIAWFDFHELCGGHYDQEDYLAIAQCYAMVLLSGIPAMQEGRGAEARRFTWLVDVLYDNRVKLAASFEVAPENVFSGGELEDEPSRIASRLAEMQSRKYLELPHRRRSAAIREM